MKIYISLQASMNILNCSGNDKKEVLKTKGQRLPPDRSVVYYGTETPSSINLPIFEN
jgi:hypothetical protein